MCSSCTEEPVSPEELCANFSVKTGLGGEDLPRSPPDVHSAPAGPALNLSVAPATGTVEAENASRAADNSVDNAPVGTPAGRVTLDSAGSESERTALPAAAQ